MCLLSCHLLTLVVQEIVYLQFGLVSLVSYVRELLSTARHLRLQGVFNFLLRIVAAFCCFVSEFFGRSKRAIELTVLR